MSKTKRELQVVEIATREVVSRVDVTGKSDNSIDRIERGMLINMDTDRFFVRDSSTV
jgi:hypothetical protein